MAVAWPEPEGLPLSIQARFAQLQQRYVSGLAARWSEIEVASTSQGSGLQDALHHLCGSAASYGFDLLGRQARLAEQLVARGDAPALAQALQELRLEIDRVCGAFTAG